MASGTEWEARGRKIGVRNRRVVFLGALKAVVGMASWEIRHDVPSERGASSLILSLAVLVVIRVPAVECEDLMALRADDGAIVTTLGVAETANLWGRCDSQRCNRGLC